MHVSRIHPLRLERVARVCVVSLIPTRQPILLSRGVRLVTALEVATIDVRIEAKASVQRLLPDTHHAHQGLLPAKAVTLVFSAVAKRVSLSVSIRQTLLWRPSEIH